MSNEDAASAPGAESGQPPKKSPIAKAIPWVIAIACFAFLYFVKLRPAAAQHGLSVVAYLTNVFADVDWNTWLALMVPYSMFFFLIDSLVIWRVVNWFNASVRYLDILPIRGSSYIISLLDERVGKGAMAMYLNRSHGVPGWEVGSSMLFVMLCEFYYLLFWALIGWTISRDVLPEIFDVIPIVAVVAVIFLPLFLAFFHGRFSFGEELRSKPIFKAFREARLSQVVQVIVLRSPAIIVAIFVYTWAIHLFGLDHVTFAEMAGVVPVIFFGATIPGPMRIVAVNLWVALFPGYEGQMTAFGFVQHNFFILFNATLGLLFLRRANRELFEEAPRSVA